jgi:alkanesulfonate monooxygenase SsuD/methylene tetrahydromethanopterin reductase-like flavin-dependent oxidoreductase (luciferase family)
VDLGLLLQPLHFPNREPWDAAQWNLEVLSWADELGYAEAWIGSHYTQPFEPIPSPDLLIAQALRETTTIKLGTGVLLLPYSHPVEVAHRVAYLDHLAQGRFLLGVGPGSGRTDAQLFGIPSAQNPAMMRESLAIMKQIWAADGPFEFLGDYWQVQYSGPDVESRSQLHIRPFQYPHPPIAVGGGSPRSSSLRFAGAEGYAPFSFNLPARGLIGQWDAYTAGASAANRVADRASWRVLRDCFVADTDAEAMKHSVGGMLGRVQREFMLPMYSRQGILREYSTDVTMRASEITPEVLARDLWLIGSPDTVAERLREQYELVGGWGTLLAPSYDYAHDPGPWRHSMELMITEVMPRLADLKFA